VLLPPFLVEVLVKGVVVSQARKAVHCRQPLQGEIRALELGRTQLHDLLQFRLPRAEVALVVLQYLKNAVIRQSFALNEPDETPALVHDEPGVARAEPEASLRVLAKASHDRIGEALRGVPLLDVVLKDAARRIKGRASHRGEE
jgi:hypothetical protein